MRILSFNFSIVQLYKMWLLAFIIINIIIISLEFSNPKIVKLNN